MDLRDSLNRYYYDVTVSDLRQISRTLAAESCLIIASCIWM